MGTFDAIIGTMCNFNTKMTVYKCEKLLAPKDTINWESFSNSIRKFMINEFKLKDTGGRYRDVRAFEKKYMK